MIFVLVLLVCATYVAAISVSASVLYSAILANTVANVSDLCDRTQLMILLLLLMSSLMSGPLSICILYSY